ncbi:MAG TPA: flagellar motor switch protein FliG [Solirubrobacteraceae bacterium]|nr:flagellar motor switch protein FliG [Solirubrobacteraceae bacterium]
MSEQEAMLDPTMPPQPLPSGLSGARKAAILMAALGPERAAGVLRQLGEQEIESVSLELAKLNAIGSETTDSVLGELAALVDGAGAGARGGVELARAVIEQALDPERAAELLARLSSVSQSRPFEFLRHAPVEQTAAVLHGESAQTIALVLANLPSGMAAEVLSHLSERVRPEVAHRIASMGEAAPAVIRQVEDSIRGRLSAAIQREYAVAGGAKTLAEILNHTDRSTERDVLDALAAADKELAEEVRGMLFVFEDIVTLDERSVQQLLREVDQKDLVLALRGAGEEVRELVLANMSERGAAMLKEEMEIQQPQRRRDVEEAQTRIVAVVRRLEQAGTIVIAGAEGEEAEAVV